MKTNLASLLPSLTSVQSARSRRRSRYSRLALERLEERTVLSSFVAAFGGESTEQLKPPGALDSAGNSYLSGSFTSLTADFAPGPAEVLLGSAGEYDAFVAKYDSNGNLAWAKRYGGPGTEHTYRAVYSQEGANGFVYVVGTFEGTVEFGPSGGTLTSAGDYDVFVLKLNALDGSTVWAKRVGGSEGEDVYDLNLTDNHEVCLTGGFAGTADFDPGAGTANLTAVGSVDAFVVTLNSSGDYVAAWQVASSNFSRGISLVVDGSDVYLWGIFGGTADFDPSASGNVSKTAVNTNDWFLASYTTTGQLNWAQAMQTAGTPGYGRRISQDATSLYLAGEFNEYAGTTDIDPGPAVHPLVSAGGADIVVAKFAKTDGSLDWAKEFGGTGLDNGFATVVEAGLLYVSGVFQSTSLDFNPAAPGGEVFNPSGQDGFILTLDAATGAYVSVSQIGGEGGSAATFVYDVTGPTVHVAGYFGGTTDFPTGGTLSTTSHEGFLMALDQSESQRFNIGNATKYEGNSGTSTLTFNVTRTGDTSGSSTVAWTTENGTAASGSDYVAASGQVVFGPGQTSQPITITISGDTQIEADETFFVRLTSATSGAIVATLSVTGSSGVGTIADDDGTKFYVVNDGSPDRTYEYNTLGGSIENYSLASGNTASRGAASTAVGNKVWVIDANKYVYVYGPAGNFLGSWRAQYFTSGASNPQGIATNGTDVWIVDAKSDTVYRFFGTANALSGVYGPGSSFALASGNTNPKDIVSDGQSIWVLDDGSKTDKVFKYTVTGTLLGSWTITSGGGSPTGITLDPLNVNHLWIVDSNTDRVYQFNAAASRFSGSQSPSTSFALAAGNTNPQGIADPPVERVQGSGFGVQAAEVGVQSAAIADAANDSALLAVIGELDGWLTGGKKRR